MLLFVATPCYGGMVCATYTASVLRLKTACMQVGLPIQFYMHHGESLITRARNECVARFLDSEATHLVFIDSDIGFDPTAVFRLHTSGYDIACGVYPLKCDTETFPVDYDALGAVDEKGFVKAEMATTGFMCIARRVFEKLREAYAGLYYETDIGEARDAFFDTAIDKETRRYLSEDYNFCKMWTGIGGEIYIDTTCNLKHQGLKVYSGDFAAGLRERSL